MNKTIDERLFEQLMKAPHSLRREIMKAKCGKGNGEGCGKHGHGGPGMHCHGQHGSGGPGMHGHGPCGHGGPGMHNHGPHGHGGPGMHGHGPHGHGGPGMHGHGGRRMRAFAQEKMLGTLVDFEEGIRQKELVEALGVNPSSVSEIISKLEGEGYVVRTVDPSDKRATLISLTEVGRARAYELEDERKERFSKLFTRLTEDEKEQLVSLLEKLTVAEEEEGEEDK